MSGTGPDPPDASGVGQAPGAVSGRAGAGAREGGEAREQGGDLGLAVHGVVRGGRAVLAVADDDADAAPREGRKASSSVRSSPT